MNDTTIKIDLKKSGDANAFDDQNQIHVREFESITHIIDEQIQTAKDDVNLTDKKYNNTIAVFGARGTGKTSFLKSVLKHYTEKKGNEIVVLNIIDPTEIEEKGHLFLLLISVINGMVSKQLEQGECKPNSTDYDKRKRWMVCLEKLSKGLPSLDNIGNKYDSDSWQSERYIMEMGLTSVKAAFDLESNFRKLIDIALDILDKKAILISFDDIDVDFRKGWQVLEVIRKYLKSPRIITIISGDYNLYSLNIRKQQFKYLGINANNANIVDHLQVKTLLNSLEYQYFIKVMPPDKMIMLKPIYANINAGIQYEVVNHGLGEEGLSVKNFYKRLLYCCGINNSSDTILLQNFLLSLPLRTQICIMKTFTGERPNLNIIKVFINILHENNIDYSSAENSVQDCVSEIIKYLVSKDIYTSCDLMPIEGDVIKSSCLFALSLMFSYHSNTNLYLFFDYGFRVGYNRSISCKYDDFKLLTSFSTQYRGKTLKEQLIYVNILENKINSQPSNCIPLLGLAKKSKKDPNGRIDTVSNKLSLAQKFLIYLPAIYFHQSNDKTNSSLYYSPIAIIASIGDMLRAYENRTLDDVLKSLCFIKDYYVDTTNNDLRCVIDKSVVEYEDEYNITSDESFKTFIDDFKNWADKFTSYMKKQKRFLSAQSVVNCFSKMYYAVENVIDQNKPFDEMVKLSLLSILNIILVEEYNNSSVNEDYFLRSNNVVSSETVFINNIMRISDANRIPVTLWFVCCPIITPFIDMDTLKIPFDDMTTDFNYINKIHIKEALSKLKNKNLSVKEMKFSGSKSNTLIVRNYLNKHGFSDDDLIKAEYNNIVNAMSPLFSNKIYEDNFIKFQHYLKEQLHK